MLRSRCGAVLLKFLCLVVLSATALAHKKVTKGVTYDGRSLIINGRRELLFSGSVHYPRSTPEFNFVGRNDLVKFIKTVWQQGLYVTLRIGPFIEAEWNFGGFPYWLKEVENITFRTDNPPFKYHMEKFTKMIVNMMKREKLYASQGGPIILSQIENEYNMIELAFKEKGKSYVQWAGNMAVGLKTGVPWVMCKQNDAPDPVVSLLSSPSFLQGTNNQRVLWPKNVFFPFFFVSVKINSCNGRNCGDTFVGPNRPNKPVLWTENWTAQYRVFGDPPSQRSAEDLAFSVARFFSKNGTLVNYYMYHGGTNFGRTASSFVTTRYYDEAPLDEYGFQKEPKWGHLRDLHSALRLCRKALLWGLPTVHTMGKDLEALVYEKPGTSVCAAFLTNNDTRVAATATFRGVEFYLPSRSISILPDCKTLVFNTQRITSQHNARGYHPVKESHRDREWKMHQEKIPRISDTYIRSMAPLELMNLTKDRTDYLWYTTSLELERGDLPMRHDISPVIEVASLGHVMHAFINNIYVGSGHGDKIEKSFAFKKAINLKAGTNRISLLGMTVGLPDSGVYLEHRMAGVHSVIIKGLNTGTLDLSTNEWGHKAGVAGESLRIYKQHGSHRVGWSNSKGSEGKPLTWYKRYFDAPHGNEPVALDLSSMGKGQAWVNGENIGRYWVSYLSPLGKPSQSMYHVPRAFLKPIGNLLVLFEETGGNPEQITIVTINRDTICSYISEFHTPHVKSWERKHGKIKAVAEMMKPHAHLKCPNHKIIKSIQFASFGDPLGICGNYTMGTCNYPGTKSVVEKACLGKTSCTIPVMHDTFGGHTCSGISKTLAVQARCGRKKN
ncbi:beta-galactosidase 11-like isoform X2 [Magnolia sinica]|uniref:beta-galactosidase 11-like isoform X2 n=1 Tax=Magnolia sinica TaxID=86752 RepID=UPI00265A2616|nr:beta-galactosidase 11-like isoform X2 [Magnolia sinica]